MNDNKMLYQFTIVMEQGAPDHAWQEVQRACLKQGSITRQGDGEIHFETEADFDTDPKNIVGYFRKKAFVSKVIQTHPIAEVVPWPKKTTVNKKKGIKKLMEQLGDALKKASDL